MDCRFINSDHALSFCTQEIVSMKETTELETQKQIFNTVEEHPGLNISKIAELLNIHEPLALYHLRYLEKNGLLIFEKENGYTRCYIKGSIGSEDKKKLSILRQEIPLKIVLYLIKHPYSKHKNILEKFDLAKSTLSYHLKKLIKHGIINIEKIGDEQGYRVVNEKDIIRFLVNYKPLKIAMGLKDTWADFTIYAEKDAGD